MTLAPVSFAGAADGADGADAGADGEEDSRTVTGHLEPGAPDFVYLPVDVPRGVREIHVAYRYDRPQVPAGTTGNALDIGIFDERGTHDGGRGFRGWSGGFRTEFAISADRAATTPAYLPGPVRAGRWHVVLGPYTIAPRGLDYEVTITLRYGPAGETAPPRFPPERAKGRGRAWYRGDCHLHTVHSDGARTPAETAAAARAAKLDFLTTTEHNTSSGHAAWDGLWGDDLLVLCGEEVTTRNGHYLAVGTDPGVFVDWRYRARDDAYPRYVRQIHAAGGLVVPAHPNCPFVGCQWKFGYEGADAVEVWNGPWTTDDELAVAAWDNALTAGREGGGPMDWLPAVGNSDAHRDGQVVGLPQTVVLADDLSRQALLAGLRAGRSWLAESADVDLEFTASGPRGEHAGIGERLRAAADGKVTVRLKVTGGPAKAQVRFMTDEGQLYATTLADGAGTVEWQTTPSYAAFVRAEVRHPAADGGASGLPGAMAAMTNPIWLGR
ncbi:CehA/McbA family metallohydrolase [Streptomyces sp. WAC 06738]|uniref:CehA/McbA family metallohydrolase n=1 Tax=Streptomyces sp. WAC 06738 TaxID=2203210 RepID=UPI0013E001E3|nr:CehA/McbA family metallohydrolase [Streptomyces sp. WAC 06738]